MIKTIKNKKALISSLTQKIISLVVIALLILAIAAVIYFVLYK